ncbi:hypothetical protein [Brevibacillus borstelensis]|uniref:hypothetical protein n=1 Tax=Brevibacillus borstelensis TaxID=45462 RepID=UPI00287F5AAE|nr:hypothetical protein [Brevibacillus borstelensis]WNF07424.1 hypothetical protein RFB14_08455 [Brevibacillus borstelensis]
MLQLKQVADGKKLGMYLDNTPENREKALLVMGAMLNGDLTEINTLNGVARMLETHLSYMSEKFEWLERKNAEMSEEIAALRRKFEEFPGGADVLPPKRKPGRPSKGQLTEWERQYHVILELHEEYVAAKGYDTNDNWAMSCTWRNIYRGYRMLTGYSPREKAKHPSFGSEKPTKLMRYILDGHGDSLAAYIREQIASSKQAVTLRLNPLYAAH